MTWFKVDDSLPDHPKMVRLQSIKGWQGALALWTLAGAWASRHLTDGVIPSAIVARLGCAKRDADLLVKVGMWAQAPDGDYAFHGWAERNPTRKDVEEKREKTRSKVSEWRRNQVTSEVTREQCNPAPVPTRPDPSRPDGDPLTPFGDSSGVRVREVPPSAEETQRRFRALYLERFNAEPYMGGQAVHTFHERLIGTARARGAEPLALMAEAFERWASEPRDKIGQNAPYASFAGRFGSLLESQSGHGVSEQEQLQTAQIEAMQRKDMVRYRELVAEERRRFPSPKGGADANTAR